MKIMFHNNCFTIIYAMGLKYFIIKVIIMNQSYYFLIIIMLVTFNFKC
jgi:hypothetical protein